MDGGMRRVEAVLERPFAGKPAGFRRDIGDRLGGGVHGVDALGWFARMAGPAAHRGR